MKTKKTFLIATLLLVASGTQAQFITSSPDYAPKTTATEGLRGSVKELEQVEIYYVDGEELRDDTLYLHFDPNGRLLEQKSLWHAEYPYERYIYSGDVLTEVICWNWEDTIRLFYHYSADGCLETVRLNYYAFFEEKRTEDTAHFQCDELCRIIMEKEINEDSTFYTYDREGHLVTRSGNYYSNTFEYDNQGNLTKFVLKNGNFTREIIYSRNLHGDITEYQRTDSDGATEYHHYDHGDITEYQRTDSDGATEYHHYEYTYDNHGNWLTRTEGICITTRKITYYE
ncbi:MAG: hypothetical protein J6V98_04500 [Bacteroidales bacterium]|nr:hypothetical protein [Bacteroidales bacterium]